MRAFGPRKRRIFGQISLRSRGKYQRPFDKVVQIRKDAEVKFRQREKELEDKLRAEWGGMKTGKSWDESREEVRRGWDYGLKSTPHQSGKGGVS